MVAKVVGSILTFLGVLYAIFILFLYLNSPLRHDWYGRFYDLMEINLIWPIIIDLFMLVVGLILAFGIKTAPDEVDHLE